MGSNLHFKGVLGSLLLAPLELCVLPQLAHGGHLPHLGHLLRRHRRFEQPFIPARRPSSFSEVSWQLSAGMAAQL